MTTENTTTKVRGSFTKEFDAKSESDMNWAADEVLLLMNHLNASQKERILGTVVGKIHDDKIAVAYIARDQVARIVAEELKLSTDSGETTSNITDVILRSHVWSGLEKRMNAFARAQIAATVQALKHG